MVDSFCAVSEFTKNEMVEHLAIDPERIRVTPLGYDKVLFNEIDDPEAQAVLSRFGVPEKFVLFVGSGDPRKNLGAALAAMEESRSRLPLVTVGWSGWHRVAGGKTVNLGYVSDAVLAQLYRRAQLLVMPSEYEGFGLPVVEAMACGCPVVSSLAPALLEVGGGSLLTVADVTDSRLFGRMIDKVAESPEIRERMRQDGLLRTEKFTWERTAAETVSQWG